MGSLAPRIAAVLLAVACIAPLHAQTHDAIHYKPFSFSILEDYDKDEDLAQVEADFLLFRELGIRTWRGSFGWDDYEPERGVYDFEWLHRFAELAARHGIALRPYIGYTPAWAAAPGGEDAAPWNNPPARLEDWSRFVAALAAALDRHDNLLSFEIYNEQNSPMWWDGSAREYAHVLSQASCAIRAERSERRVLVGGITYPDVSWLETVCAKARDAFDVLPLHAYPETWPPDAEVETWLDLDAPGSFHTRFLASADRQCGTRPVWINETGFATTPGRASERDQANWWARAIATFAADPRIEHVGIYEIKDRPLTADVIGEPENHFLGLTYPDRKKKLAFHTVRRLVSLMDTGIIGVADDASTVEVIAGRAGELYHHVFIRPDGRQVVFLWDKRGTPVLELRLPHTGEAATEYRLDGSGAAYLDFDGRTLRNVRLTPGEVRVFAIGPAQAGQPTR